MAADRVAGLRRRARWAKWGLGLSSAIHFAAALVFLALISGRDVLDAAITFSVLPQLSVLLVAPFFIAWAHRAHANLFHLGIRGQLYSDRGTIWWWLVPVANLFMPFRVMYEIMRGSKPYEGKGDWRIAPLHQSAVWWTVLFLGGLLADRASGVMLESADTLGEVSASIATAAVGLVATTGAGWAAMTMVEYITSHQEAAVVRRQPDADAPNR